MWLLGWKESSGTLGPLTPLQPSGTITVDLSATFCPPPPSLSHLQTLPGLCPKRASTASQDVNCMEAGGFPARPITTLRVPTERKRKAIVKSCLSEDGGLLYFLQAWDPSLLSDTKPGGDQCLGLWPPKASDPPTAERIPGAQDNGLLKPQKVAQCCIVACDAAS